MFVTIHCPPLPYLIVGGRSNFRAGDIHERRNLDTVFNAIVVTGGALHMDVGDDSFTVVAGEYLLMPPGIPHGGSRYCDVDTQFSWMHFQADGGFELSRVDIPDRMLRVDKTKFYHRDPFDFRFALYGVLDSHERSTIAAYFEQVSQVFVSRERHTKEYIAGPPHIEQQRAFLGILAILSSARGDSTKKKDLANAVYDYLQAHDSERISLHRLAQEFMFSEAHICRQVGARFGKSPLQLGIDMRIRKAANLLATTTMSIGEVGKATGFVSASNFSRQFQKILGTSPSRYRNALERSWAESKK